MMANMIKAVLTCTRAYPAMLAKLRSLCKFFRMEAYRRHLQKQFANNPAVRVAKLQHFTATLAKWRFETMYVVMKQLLALSDFCQHHFKASIMGKVKDASLLNEVSAACADTGLWQWMTIVFRLLVAPLERIRRWGLTCPCHDPNLPAVACDRKSRKLHLVVPYIREQVSELQEACTRLTYSDCFCVEWLFSDVRRMLQKAISELVMRTGHYDRIPWSFARADEPAVARQCITELDSKSLEEHEHLSQHVGTTLRTDLETVAGGALPSRPLQAEIDEIRNSPLNEGPGEAVHRDTHHSKRRAPGGRLPFVQGSLRFRQNIKRIKRFLRSDMNARSVYRYEWHNYKRVLQTSAKHRHRPIRIGTNQFYKKLYRIEQYDTPDWATVVQGGPPSHSRPPADKPTAFDKMRTEYTQSVLQTQKIYSVPNVVSRPDADGVAEQVSVFFFDAFPQSQVRTKRRGVHRII